MSDAQQVPAIVILGQGALDTARRVQARYPGALVHGLAGRVEADRSYTDFGDTLRELYCADRPIVALCAAGIVIRSLAPLLQRKGAEPPRSRPPAARPCRCNSTCATSRPWRRP
nr:hypothetical protein [Pseudomonas aeruginosa]